MAAKVDKEFLIWFENHVKNLFEAGRIKVPVHLSGSVDEKYEDELIDIFDKIEDEDYVFSNHRNHYHYLLKTGNKHGLLEELLRNRSGVCGGASGSMHTIDRDHNFFSSAIVAGCVSIAVGVAWALKASNSINRVYCFVGDGATDSGWFAEALRYSEGHKLPIKFIIEDNNRSVCTDKVTRWGKNGKMYYNKDYMDVLAYEPKYPHAGTGVFVEF